MTRDYYLESLQTVAKDIEDNDPAYYEERQKRIDMLWMHSMEKFLRIEKQLKNVPF